MAITAFTEASVALDDPGLADAARCCARSLLDLHLVDGRLRRASLGGVVGDSAAILEDHAMLATGLLALYQLSAEDSWLTAATDLLNTALAHFADPQRPGRWFDTADDAERLMLRLADPLDGATPSGASSVTEALLTAAHLVGGQRTERYLRAATGRAARARGAAGTRPAHGRALAGRRRRRLRMPRPGLRPAGDPHTRTGRHPGCGRALAASTLRRMPNDAKTDAIRNTVHRYIELVAKGGADDLVELYADDATVEGPVGGEVHIPARPPTASTPRSTTCSANASC